MLSTTTHVYSEVEGVETLLTGVNGFRVVQLGLCRGIQHPTFGIDVYPASIFTTASLDKIGQVLTENAFNLQS